MGCYKIGSECCNNCVHWDCHSERKFIGNPPTEVYTDSNSDKCFLTGRNTLSKNCCGMFKHLGGITRTFAAEQKHAENDYMSNMLDACDETSRVFLQGMIGSIRMESAEHIVEIAQNQRRIEAANSENEKRSILIRNGMDSKASSEDQQAFEALYRGACDGEPDGLLYLGEAFRTNRYGAVLDAEKAVKLFKMAACKGSSDAEVRLADCYLNGEGVGKDEKIGQAWLARAADHGNAIAKGQLAKMMEAQERARLIEEQKARERAYRDELEKYVENNGMDPDASDMAKLLFSAMFESAKDGQIDAQLELADAYDKHDKGAVEDKARSLFWYRKAAAQGSDKAIEKVGEAYYWGKGVAVDEKEAVRMFMRAAEKGNATAMTRLGECHFNGRGVEKNVKLGVEWYVKAANKGSALAQVCLGKMYAKGNEVIGKDMNEAFKWFKRAAEKRADATAYLGLCYEKGYGVEANVKKAGKLYEEAAECNDAMGCYHFARCLEDGLCGIKASLNRALVYYKKAAGKGWSKAYVRIGDFYRAGWSVDKDESEALKWYQKSADKGGRDGVFWVALFYEEGRGGLPKNLALARELFEKSAARGGVDACCALGWIYQLGEGVDVDFVKAVEWFRKGADLGDGVCMNNLARLIEEGKGVEQNYDEALRLFKRAAEKSCTRANYHIGRFYEKGLGVAIDMVEALSWYKKAADKGDKDAQAVVKRFW